jgi:alkaline phosphatase D
MRLKSTLGLILVFIIQFTFANDPNRRLDLNPLLAPFYHGVASGDPLSDAVIIWTRISTTESSEDVAWEISEDTSFSNIVASGNFVTDASRDYTVKVDVTGLNSNTYYYYRFKAADGTYSMIGRTKTAPTADEVEQLRFATVSCSSFQHGFFNVYNTITERNDIDAVIHLGDYIYEYGPGEYGDLRDHEPAKEIVELIDYRTRYAQYRLDPALRNIHQQYPFIVMWDDHETADNSFRDGAENHQPVIEGTWEDRLSVAAKAYMEWLPIRQVDPDNDIKIYRQFNYGNLADIFALDTRIIGRDEQIGFFDQIFPDVLNDTTRKLLGDEQMAWLKNGLQNSTAKWKVLAQQVMVGPFRVFDIIANSDQWDGYEAERQSLFYFIDDNDIDNVVVLTGDIHTSWAMDLPVGRSQYVPTTGENSVGVEFVTTSVTSPGFPIGTLVPIIKEENPHMKHINLTDHGFGLLTLDAEKTQNDFYFVNTIETINDNYRYGTGLFTNDGDNFLNRALESVESIYEPAIMAPDPTDTSEVVTALPISNIVITGIYPNPVSNGNVTLQFFVQEQENIQIQLFNSAGALIMNLDLGNRQRGIYRENISLPNIPAGNYIVAFKHGDKVASQSLIKINQ